MGGGPAWHSSSGTGDMIDRREALSGLMLSGVMLSAGGTAVARPRAGRSGLDVGSAPGRLSTYMKMRGALDEALVANWVSAQYYGVVEDRMDPLFGVVSAVFTRCRKLSDGGFGMVSFELAWFTDPVTGKAMDTFRNPYTGKDCKVPAGGLPPSASRIAPDLSFHLAREVPGLVMEHELLPFDVRGDDVRVVERLRTAASFPGAVKPFRYSDSITYHASRKALERPGATRVKTEVSYTNVCSWRPWLEMGDRPGHLTATGIGRQNSSLDEFPPAWIETTAARRPEVLKDPAAILAPLWNAKP